jgi:hypothetical protein
MWWYQTHCRCLTEGPLTDDLWSLHYLFMIYLSRDPWHYCAVCLREAVIVHFLFNLYFVKSVKNKFLFYNDGLARPNPRIITRMTLDQLCATLSDSQSQPVVIQPGIEPGSIVTPLALRCSALDRCATRVNALLSCCVPWESFVLPP